MTAVEATPERAVGAALPDAASRLQRLGGVAAMLGGMLALAAWTPQLTGAAEAMLGIGSAMALLVSAGLLITGLLGRRVTLGWAKLGGIALIVYCCWWLAAWAAPLLLGDPAAAPADAAALVRLLVGLVAATAIAARWPVSGFNRWSVFLIVVCDVLTTYGWVAAAFGSVALYSALSLTLPLALIAFGAGHALAGVRRSGA